MKNRAYLATLLVVGVLVWQFGPAAARSEDRPSAADEACDAKLRSLMSKWLTPESTFAGVGKTCTITHLRFQTTSRFGWSIDQLSIVKSSPTIMLGEGLRAEARGIRSSPDTGDARSRYLIKAQQHPFDVRIDYVVDRKSGHMQVNELTIESPSLGMATISMVADVNAVAADVLPDTSEIAVRTVHLTLDNKFIFESMILPLWVSAMDDDNPETAIPKQLAMDATQIRELSASVIDTKSRDALLRFLKDLPHPAGRLDLSLSFSKPQKFKARAAALNSKGFWQEVARIDARYDPATVPVAR